MMIKCNMCETKFNESEIVYDSEDDIEYCPKCGENGCLMYKPGKRTHDWLKFTNPNFPAIRKLGRT